MNEHVLDLEAELRQLKLDEHCIGFAGFGFTALGRTREGLIKISSDTRSDRHGYLTLSFLMDVDQDLELIQSIQSMFSRLTKAKLTRRLGEDFWDSVLSEPGAERSRDWILVDLDLFFHDLEGREKTLVENRIFPALRDILDLDMEQPQWFDDANNPLTPSMLKRFSRSLSAFFSRRE